MKTIGLILMTIAGLAMAANADMEEEIRQNIAAVPPPAPEICGRGYWSMIRRLQFERKELAWHQVVAGANAFVMSFPECENWDRFDRKE